MRHEDHRRARIRPDAQEFEIQPLARHLVERTERLVHEQQWRRERQGSRDRDALLHPARELPREVLLEPGQLDELDHLCNPRLPARPVPALHLERQRDVLRHRAPVEENRRLEDDPVVTVFASLARLLSVDGHVAARRLGDIPDDAEKSRLAAARRADERHEVASLDIEVDPLECDDTALPEDLRDVLDRDDVL